jgi:leucyl-tRNA synthetase
MMSKKDVSDTIMNDALKNLALLLNPFAPHLSEECYSLVGGKGFSSIAKWPHYDESKIDLKLHYRETIVKDISKDIRSVLELAKIEKPKEIEIIISEQWKYEFYSMLKELVSVGIRNTGELSKTHYEFRIKKTWTRHNEGATEISR